MKKNQAVLNRVYKYRERKGIKITDTDSGLYITFKVIFILGFVWLMAMQSMYLLGQLLQFTDAAAAKGVLMMPFYLICAATVVIILGFILLLTFKQHIAGGVLELVGLTVTGYEFHYLLVEVNGGIDSLTYFWWRHGVPAAIMMLCCAVMCFIGIRAKYCLNRDYKRVLEIVYINNKERLSTATDEDWQQIVDELDDSQIVGSVGAEPVAGQETEDNE